MPTAEERARPPLPTEFWHEVGDWAGATHNDLMAAHVTRIMEIVENWANRQLREAEADGFRRGRQVGSEGAILAVRQYFADGQECIPAAALPTADACERCIRAFMEKPDE